MSPTIQSKQTPPPVPTRYRVRTQPVAQSQLPTVDEDDLSSSERMSQSRWTRGSLVSSFADGNLGVTLGRAMRSFGRLVIDPLDNFIGIREFEKVDAYLAGLDVEQWRILQQNFDAEAYAPRLVEVLRPVYPAKLRALAQVITLRLAIWGKVTFQQVIPRVHFSCKNDLQESMHDLAIAARMRFPRSLLLLCLPSTNNSRDFMSLLRRELEADIGEDLFHADKPVQNQLKFHLSWGDQVNKLSHLSQFGPAVLCLSYLDPNNAHIQLEEFLRSSAANVLPSILVEHNLLDMFCKEVSFVMCHGISTATCYIAAVLLSQNQLCEQQMTKYLLDSSIDGGEEWAFANFCANLDRSGAFGQQLASKVVGIMQRHENVEEVTWNKFISNRYLWSLNTVITVLEERPTSPFHLRMLREWLPSGHSLGQLAEVYLSSPLKTTELEDFLEAVRSMVGLDELVTSAYLKFESFNSHQCQIVNAQIITSLAMLMWMADASTAIQMRKCLISQYNSEMLSWQKEGLRTTGQVTSYVMFHRVLDLRPELWAQQYKGRLKRRVTSRLRRTVGTTEPMWEIQGRRAWDSVVAYPRQLANEAEASWFRAGGGAFWDKSCLVEL